MQNILMKKKREEAVFHIIMLLIENVFKQENAFVLNTE